MDKCWTLQQLTSDVASQLKTTIHLGALVPWANVAMEAELPYIFPQRVVWHFTRLVPPSYTTALDEKFLQGMINAIPQAVFQLCNLPLHALAFGCTSASAAYSVSFPDDEAIFCKCVPFLTAFSAILYVLSLHRVKRIALVTPYEEPITQKEVQAFAASEIEVLQSTSMGYRDRIGAIRNDEVLEACKESIPCEAEALVISCTALHTHQLIPILEQQYGLPVISSNTAIALASVLLGMKSNHSLWRTHNVKR
jgi:maleate isomerase